MPKRSGTWLMLGPSHVPAALLKHELTRTAYTKPYIAFKPLERRKGNETLGVDSHSFAICET
jgi:hypothetical protein